MRNASYSNLSGAFQPSFLRRQAPRSQTQGRVAQLAEHSALNRQVEGSIPSAPTIHLASSCPTRGGVDSISGVSYVRR